jgi:hypothetical protein
MPNRRVTHTEKSPRGVITGLCGPSFGYRSLVDVIADIEVGSDRFYVREAPFETRIRVVRESTEPRLVSTSDILSRNNLSNLPNC